MAVVARDRSAASSGSELPPPLVFLGATWPLLVALLWLAAGMLLWGRRLCGALDHPLPAPALCLAGVVLAAGSELLGRCLTSSGLVAGAAQAGWRGAPRWIPLLAAWLMGAAIWLPGSYWLGSLILWACLALALGWTVFDQRRRASGNPNAQICATTSIAGPATRPLVAADESLAESDSLPDAIVQQLVRRHEADGTEWITGLVRVRFEPGQRTAHAHVAFCPPLSAVPDCEAETISGPEAQLSVGQVLPQGARFDLRLAQVPAAAADVVLEFAAHLAAGES